MREGSSGESREALIEGGHPCNCKPAIRLDKSESKVTIMSVVAANINSFSGHPRDAGLFARYGFGAQTSIPFETVHQAFIHHATHNPSGIALLDLSAGSPREVTYGELLCQSQFIAIHLKLHGVKPGSRVLLLVKRSAEMVAGILGILMVGAQYIPIDGGIVPYQTLQHVAQQSGVTVALCLRPFEERLRLLDIVSSTVVLEDLFRSEAYTHFDLDRNHLLCEGRPESGCYVIYTSGEYIALASSLLV
jgi:acyl-CoA synthetase (AMP-forming)/AMP-acid ligase II